MNSRITALLFLVLLTMPMHAADIVRMDCWFGVYQDCIMVRGKIGLSDFEKFDDATKGMSEGIVLLDSPGGDVMTGMAIGLLIFEKKYITAIVENKVCASMCAGIWLAGKRHFIAPSGALGFHSTGIAGVRSKSGNAAMRMYYEKVGLRREAIDSLLSADPNNMMWLSTELGERLGSSLNSGRPKLNDRSGRRH
jgi:hypothetical protein